MFNVFKKLKPMKKLLKIYINQEGLYKTAKALNARQAHHKAEKILKDKDVSVFVSIYIGERPSHEVLYELNKWAEENKNEELLNKIQKLAEIKNTK